MEEGAGMEGRGSVIALTLRTKKQKSEGGKMSGLAGNFIFQNKMAAAR